jgi:hypothetical protein
MKVIVDDLWLCGDCTQAAVNDDYTGLDYYLQPEDAAHRQAQIEAGLAKLGPHLISANGCEEFSTRRCDCCGTNLHGHRDEFAVLGE